MPVSEGAGDGVGPGRDTGGPFVAFNVTPNGEGEEAGEAVVLIGCGTVASGTGATVRFGAGGEAGVTGALLLLLLSGSV